MSLNDFAMIHILENEDNYSLLKVKNKKNGITYILKNIKLQMLDINKKIEIITLFFDTRNK